MGERTVIIASRPALCESPMNASLDPIFVSLGTTGPDPVQDGVYYAEATSYVEGEGCQPFFEAIQCSPFGPGAAPESAPKWLADKGLSGKALQELEPWEEALRAPLAALEARPVVIASDRPSFLERFRHLCPTSEPPTVLDLCALASFLHPQRGENNFDSLFLSYCGEAADSPPNPDQLRRLLVALVQRHFERDRVLRHLFARGFEDLRFECGSDQTVTWEWL